MMDFSSDATIFYGGDGDFDAKTAFSCEELLEGQFDVSSIQDTNNDTINISKHCEEQIVMMLKVARWIDSQRCVTQDEVTQLGEEEEESSMNGYLGDESEVDSMPHMMAQLEGRRDEDEICVLSTDEDDEEGEDEDDEEGEDEDDEEGEDEDDEEGGDEDDEEGGDEVDEERGDEDDEEGEDEEYTMSPHDANKKRALLKIFGNAAKRTRL